MVTHWMGSIKHGRLKVNITGIIHLYYWWDEGLRRDHPVVIEPEILMSNYSFLSYNAMSWGYWTAGARDSEVTPFVSMYKAVTRGRHLTHLTERSICPCCQAPVQIQLQSRSILQGDQIFNFSFLLTMCPIHY